MDKLDPSADAELRHHIRVQELARVRAQAREEAHLAAWTEVRRRFRFLVAGLAGVSLLVGGAIGFYGFRAASVGSGPDLEPPARWSSMDLSDSLVDPGSTAIPLTPWPIRVYVSGAVKEPRVVELAAGSLITHALAAAGGPTADADLEALNLAAPLSDSQHIQVPRITTPADAAELDDESSSATVDVSVRPLDINTASAAQLESLPGIGPTRAQNIVAYRQEHGPFQRAEELLAVPGIGPATYERIGSLIRVGP